MDNVIKTAFPKEVLNLFDMHVQPGLNKIFPYNIEETNCVKALFYLLSIYGYEIIRDNFSIKIVDRVGNENGITVKYGKNILGIEAIEDTSELITKIYPVGKSGLKLPERYIEVDNINDTSLYIPYPIIKR
ncbi:phage tail protein [Caloramator sp. mosi_1]|nr:phage tail spike protein [Caloramator sp. mosi_1]WDC85750.1 phage tail protein [Caloramator sp. mosi_1]